MPFGRRIPRRSGVLSRVPQEAHMSCRASSRALPAAPLLFLRRRHPILDALLRFPFSREWVQRHYRAVRPLGRRPRHRHA